MMWCDINICKAYKIFCFALFWRSPHWSPGALWDGKGMGNPDMELSPFESRDFIVDLPYLLKIAIFHSYVVHVYQRVYAMDHHRWMAQGATNVTRNQSTVRDQRIWTTCLPRTPLWKLNTSDSSWHVESYGLSYVCNVIIYIYLEIHTTKIFWSFVSVLFCLVGSSKTRRFTKNTYELDEN